MKHPLVLLVLCYCLGIILAAVCRISFWPVFCLELFLLLAAYLLPGSSKISSLSICLLLFMLGTLCLKNSYILPRAHLVYYSRDNSGPVLIKGFIDSVPLEKDGGLSFILRCKQAQNEKWGSQVCGKVQVNLSFARDLKYGDMLIIKGRLLRPAFFGKSSYRQYLYRQGVYLCMNIKSSLQLCRLQDNCAPRWKRLVLAARSRIERAFGAYLSPLPASVLEAMVLGQRRSLPQLVNNSMVKTGTVHILVVSGFNVGIVGFSVNLLLKMLRIRLKIRLLICVFCLLFYCLLTGASNPVVRATVMGVVFLCSYIARRQANIYNSLGLSAFFILFINPRQIFDVGFQLSFVSVLAIAYIYPRLRQLFRVGNLKIPVCRFLAEGLLVSLSSWLGTIGIIAANFRIISPVSAFANILIVPLAGLITLCGFLLTACALILTPLAHPVAVTSEFLVALLLQINLFFTAIPFAYFYL